MDGEEAVSRADAAEDGEGEDAGEGGPDPSGDTYPPSRVSPFFRKISGSTASTLPDVFYPVGSVSL